MKYLIVLVLFLTGCSASFTTKYTAYSCNKDGCTELLTFRDHYECMDFLSSIRNLHINIRKDMSTKILECKEE